MVLQNPQKVSVSTAGTAVRLSSGNELATKIFLQADSGNSGDIYVGDENVDSSRGLALSPDERMEISESHGSGQRPIALMHVWLDADTNGNSVRLVYLKG